MTSTASDVEASLDDIERQLHEISQRRTEPLPDLRAEQNEIEKWVDAVRRNRPAGKVDTGQLDARAEALALAAKARWEPKARGDYGKIETDLNRLESERAGLEERAIKRSEHYGKQLVDAELQIRRANELEIQPRHSLVPVPPEVEARLPPVPIGGTLPAKRSRALDILLYAVLAVVAGIDIITFYQVLALVLYDVPEVALWIGVVSFTLAALTLTHLAGQAAKEARFSTGKPYTSRTAWVCLLVWAGLAGAAFAVRAVYPSPLWGGGSQVTVDGEQVGTDVSGTALPAMLFLALYVASGTIAGIGAYRNRDPFARVRQQAEATQEAVFGLAGDTKAVLVRAQGLVRVIQRERERRELAEKAELTSWTKLTDDLVQYARASLARP